MAKLLKNKRLFITLLAGVLLLTAAIGAGTWAWFTANSDVDGTTFTMATVEL